MRLTELSVSGWRNLKDTVINCDAPLVVLHGDNGQGKSNLLEAICVLGTLKSFREPRTRRWIRHGEGAMGLNGRVQTPMGVRQIGWRWNDGVRRLQMDGAAVHELQTWFEVIRAIVFCPEDGTIVRGEPERRRRFMDRAAFTARPGHLTAVTEYRRVLGHKRALLQQPTVDPNQLSAFDTALAFHGAAVIEGRIAVIRELRRVFGRMHDAIAGTGEVDMAVTVSGLANVEGMTRDEIEKSLFSVIEEKRSQELDRRQALIGPHRDDLRLRIDGQLARNFASQGQARSIVLALKLSELDAAEQRGDIPLFLLDDLTSELDAARRGRLVEILRTLKGQVWVTTTNPSYLGDLGQVEHLNIRLNNGEISA